MRVPPAIDNLSENSYFIISMRIIRPTALRRGDVIGICAPASPPASADALDAGVRYIEQLGYRIELGKNLYRRRGYLAGSDAERVGDLHALFLNPKVKAIFTARGGYGAHRILAKLNYKLIRRNPKILVGYSDITALQTAIFAQTRLLSVSGAMVTEMPGTFKPAAEEMFWRSLTSTKPLGVIGGSKREFLKFSRGGISGGRILGGNLSLLAGLMGTPYFPLIRHSVFMLEEIDERPYRVDRTLQQLRLNRVFESARGIVLGAFIECTPARGKPSLRLHQVFEETFHELSCPILSGFRYGHIRNSLTIPLGVRVRVNGARNTLEFLESAVS